VSSAQRGTRTSSGISVQTLVIASASSLAAAIVVHEVWRGGAIIGAAITPVIVGIVGEALRRPVDRLTSVREGGRKLPADRAHDVPPPSRERGDDPFGLWEDDRRRSRGRTWLVLGLVTGVIGFAIAAFFLTGSELVFGGSVAGPRKTTIFGGGSTTRTTVETVTQQTGPATVTQTVPAPAPQTQTTPPTVTQAVPATPPGAAPPGAQATPTTPGAVPTTPAPAPGTTTPAP
jgi:hypothetical protein